MFVLELVPLDTARLVVQTLARLRVAVERPVLAVVRRYLAMLVNICVAAMQHVNHVLRVIIVRVMAVVVPNLILTTVQTKV